MSLKDLPSPNAPNFQLRVREMLHTMLGKTGSAGDRLLTLREAVASGVVKPGPGGSLVPGDAIGGGTGGEAYVPDLTPPPAPDTLTATPAISHILLEVPAATYTQGHGHLRTRVYGVTRLSGDPAPVFADAVEVGQFSGTVWAFPSNPSTTWHFWAKWESVDGVLSATPVGGTNGVVATTGQDVSSLLDALAGQISASELAADLATPIGQIPDLFAKYTVKVDVAGHVSGYGLASTANNGAVVSQFGIRADQFFVAPPATSSATAPTTNLYKGMVWVDTSVTPNVTRYYTGSAWSTTPQALPFVVQTTPQVINGETVPPGIYGENAFFARLVATRGQIGLLAVDDARIASMSVSKLTAGSIAVGQYAQSTGYVAGSSGWRINGDGTAEFSGVVVRGTIFASQGAIGGWTIGSNYLQSTTYALGTSGTRFNSDGTGQIGGITIMSDALQSTNYSAGSSGWRLRGNGELEANSGTFRGELRAAKYLSGAYTGYAWPASGNGVYLGPEGLLMGYNPALGGGYVNIAPNGYFAIPGMEVVDGNLTIYKANVIDTINLAGNAVTVPVGASASNEFTTATSGHIIISASITTNGEPVIVQGTLNGTVSTGSVTGPDARILLRRNGTVLTSAIFTNGTEISVPLTALDYPPTGTHTYDLQYTWSKVGGSSNISLTARSRSIVLLSAKR